MKGSNGANGLAVMTWACQAQNSGSTPDWRKRKRFVSHLEEGRAAHRPCHEEALRRLQRLPAQWLLATLLRTSLRIATTPERVKEPRSFPLPRSFRTMSDRGYATLLDGLLFLALVSIAAALLFTTLSRSSSLQAAQELRSQRLDTAAIDALLAVRPEGRDIGMRIGDRLLAQFVEEKDWDPGLEGVVNDTLARLLGPRYRFNLTAVWRPVPWAGPEWRFAVGPPVAERATKVERVMTLPVGEGFSELMKEKVKGPTAREMLEQSVTAVRLSLTRVKIVYCEPCGYHRSAEALEARLEQELERPLRASRVPVKEDVFDVLVNNRLVASKTLLNRIPNFDDIDLFPETWEVRAHIQALAADALDRRLNATDPARRLEEAIEWLKVEQLHTNRARVVLAIWPQ